MYRRSQSLVRSPRCESVTAFSLVDSMQRVEHDLDPKSHIVVDNVLQQDWCQDAASMPVQVGQITYRPLAIGYCQTSLTMARFYTRRLVPQSFARTSNKLAIDVFQYDVACILKSIPWSSRRSPDSTTRLQNQPCLALSNRSRAQETTALGLEHSQQERAPEQPLRLRIPGFPETQWTLPT